LGHKKSTLVERQAPEAMATAVTATWVMVEATAAWVEEPAEAAEAKSGPSDEDTTKLGLMKERNLAAVGRNFR